MSDAREQKQDYIDEDGRIWRFSLNPMGFWDYQGLRKTKNIIGTNIKLVDLVGHKVFHCTNKIKKIEVSGGLKIKEDSTGIREYGRNATHWHPFIPVKGVWITTEGKERWVGKHCISFVIEPTDSVGKTYGEGYIILNPIPWKRLTVENIK
jgi:hypothetical protein